MPETRKRPGPRKSSRPKAKSAGISLYPSEIELLDRLAPMFNLERRSDVVRRLIWDHPFARKEVA